MTERQTRIRELERRVAELEAGLDGLLSTTQVARQRGVGVDAVLGAIARGELRAHRFAEEGRAKRRYAIESEDAARWEPRPRGRPRAKRRRDAPGD